MEENNLIYGLELQARALTPQYGEGNDVCFFIATNSLKPTNQLHLLQYDEEQGTIQSKVSLKSIYCKHFSLINVFSDLRACTW